MEPLKLKKARCLHVSEIDVHKKGRLVIWGKFGGNNGDEISKLLETLDKSVCGDIQLPAIMNLHGTLCDGKWRRVKIVHQYSEDEFVVLLVDYGNKIVKKRQEIYEFPDQRRLKQPAAAISFMFHHKFTPLESCGLWTPMVARFLKSRFLFEEVDVIPTKIINLPLGLYLCDCPTLSDELLFSQLCKITKRIDERFSDDEVVTCRVCHIASYNTLYIQRTAQIKEMKELNASLDRFFYLHGNEERLKKTIFDVGMLVACCSSPGGEMRRGQIVEVHHQYCCIRLIDIGKTRSIDKEMIYELPTEFRQLPFQAVRAGFSQAYFDSADVSTRDSICTLLKEHVFRKPVLVSVVNYNPSDEPPLVITAKIGNVLIEDFIFQRLTFPTSFCSSPAGGTNRFYTNPSIQNLSSIVVKYGVRETVYILSATSLGEMYVRLAKYDHDLKGLERSLARAYSEEKLQEDSFSLPFNFVTGQRCVVITKDGESRRGTLSRKVGDSHVSVYHLDYGSYDVYDFKDVYKPTCEFFSLPAQAIKCSLICSSKELVASEEVVLLVGKLAAAAAAKHVQYQAEFVDFNEDFCGIELYYEVANELKECNPAESFASATSTESSAKVFYPFDAHKMTGKKLMVKAAQVISPGEFYFCLANVSRRPKYVKLIQDLKNFDFAVLEPISKDSLYTGMPCAIRCDDEWRRGEIVKFGSSESATVFLVDEGLKRDEKLENLFVLKREYVLAPPRASFRCSMEGIIEPTGGKWSEQSVEILRKYFAQNEKGLTCTLNCYGIDEMGICFICSVCSRSGPAVDAFLDSGEARLSGYKFPQSICIQTFVRDLSLVCKNDTYFFHITHVPEGDGLFYCQISSSSRALVELETMLSKLAEKELPPTDEALKEKRICAVDMSNGMFFRGEVLQKTGVLFDVFLVDYGFCIQSPLDRLRVNSASHFLHIPAQAFACRLADFRYEQLTMEETEQMLRILRQRSWSSSLSGFVVDNSNGVVSLRLIDERYHNLSDMVVRLAGKSNSQRSAEQNGRSILTVESVSQIRALDEVWTGHRQTVTVEYVVNPHEFYLLLESADTLRSKCISDTNRFYRSLLRNELCLSRLVVGGAVCVLVGFQWIRAIILFINGQDIYVRDIDSGRTYTVNKKNAKKLALRLVKSYPHFSIKCTLKGIIPSGSDWSKDSIIFFKNMCQGKVVRASFVGLDLVTNIWHARLEIGDDNIVCSEMLVEHGFAKMDPPPTDERISSSNLKHRESTNLKSSSNVPRSLTFHTAGSLLSHCYQKVVISHVESDSFIYLQISTQLREFITLNWQIKKTIKDHSLPPLRGVKRGDPCLAWNYGDCRYYRAAVLNADQGSRVLVRYVDFGKTGRVPESELRYLPNDLTEVPTLAFFCHLESPRTLPGSIFKFLTRDSGSTPILAKLCSKKCLHHGAFNVHLKASTKNGHISLPKYFTANSKGCSDDLGVQRKLPPLWQGNSVNFGKSKEEREAWEKGGGESNLKKDRPQPNIGHFWPKPGVCTEVKISFLKDLKFVSVQRCSKSKELERVHDHCNNQESLDPVDKPAVGAFCLVQYFPDGLWFRARVDGIVENRVLLYLVDYGSRCWMLAENIRELSKEGAEISPRLALSCRITNSQSGPVILDELDFEIAQNLMCRRPVHVVFSEVVTPNDGSCHNIKLLLDYSTHLAFLRSNGSTNSTVISEKSSKSPEFLSFYDDFDLSDSEIIGDRLYGEEYDACSSASSTTSYETVAEQGGEVSNGSVSTLQLSNSSIETSDESHIIRKKNLLTFDLVENNTSTEIDNGNAHDSTEDKKNEMPVFSDPNAKLMEMKSTSTSNEKTPKTPSSGAEYLTPLEERIMSFGNGSA